MMPAAGDLQIGIVAKQIGDFGHAVPSAPLARGRLSDTLSPLASGFRMLLLPQGRKVMVSCGMSLFASAILLMTQATLSCWLIVALENVA
jgi:hypothetical protein